MSSVESHRWEHGSEFHRVDPPELCPPQSRPWNGGAEYFRCGRDALVSLVAGRWTRVWLPTYFCADVALALRSRGITVLGYRHAPLQEAVAPNPLPSDGDAVVVLNHFGLVDSVALSWASGCDIIEDHTHDPLSSWAFRSRASYCVASLRKYLPIPDGAVAWSPTGAALPSAPIETSTFEAASLKQIGMDLKREYLSCGAVVKEHMLSTLRAGEAAFAAGGPEPMSAASRALLERLDLNQLRAARRRNFDQFTQAVGQVGGRFRVLRPTSHDCCPFSVVLVLPNEETRRALREHLIAQRIYPAILWPLDPTAISGTGAHELDLAKRTLSIHCDGRYGPSDMMEVARVVREFFSS